MSKLQEVLGNDPVVPNGLRVIAYNLRSKDPSSGYIASILEAIAEDMDGQKAVPYKPLTEEQEKKIGEYGEEIARSLQKRFAVLAELHDRSKESIKWNPIYKNLKSGSKKRGKREGL